MTYTSDSDGRSCPEKPTLFCPACDHRSHIGADWIESRIGNTHVLTCPVCGTTVDERTHRTARPPAEAD